LKGIYTQSWSLLDHLQLGLPTEKQLFNSAACLLVKKDKMMRNTFASRPYTVPPKRHEFYRIWNPQGPPPTLYTHSNTSNCWVCSDSGE
ncbi:hypothetical protein CEXT_600851, partial [Caerostris extrusa]